MLVAKLVTLQEYRDIVFGISKAAKDWKDDLKVLLGKFERPFKKQTLFVADGDTDANIFS